MLFLQEIAAQVLACARLGFTFNLILSHNNNNRMPHHEAMLHCCMPFFPVSLQEIAAQVLACARLGFTHSTFLSLAADTP
jgi:hypothetical protein